MPWSHRRPDLAEPIPILKCPGSPGSPTLYVGTWKHAQAVIPASVTFAVNCADFPVRLWYDTCVSWWLNINYWGEQDGANQWPDYYFGEEEDRPVGPMEWFGRMVTALEVAAGTLLEGEDVLFFCHHGKHRSGALCALFLALVLDISSEDARNMYYRRRGLSSPKDQGLVQWLWSSLKLDGFIAMVRRRGDMPRTDELSRDFADPGWRSRRRCQLTRRSVSRSPHESPGGDEAEQSPGVPEESRRSRRAVSRSPCSRSRSRSRESEGSASTASSIVPGTRTNRTDVPIQGAWTCANCRQLIAKWELYCTNMACGLRRPLVNWRDGDWICWACGNHNFSFRFTCEYRDCPAKIFKRYDWYCPSCGNHNYAKRQFCNRHSCGCPRPQY